MSKIGTNQMAVNAQKAMSQIQRKMTKTMEKLSTGLRINKPNDDPAGLSISTKMTSQITGYNTAAKNINDAIAMVQTIDGALGEQINLMQRMRELAVQSVSETYTNADRTMMETEFDNLVTEIVRIATDTRSRILDTDYAAELAELAKLQIMQQATNAMMAQANTTPQSVLAMLT